MTIQILTTRADLHIALSDIRAEHTSVGFVPTMGALHEGHATLIRQARRDHACVVASVFVNPKQFSPHEDLASYPRTLDADATLAQEAGATLVFAPSVEAMYPQGFDTHVAAGALATHLCGKTRSGHLDGVATVVSILLNLVRPDASYFGEKDFQQLAIIRRLAEDLALPGAIIGVPTVREADGLAMSSRNRYLNDQERMVAPMLYETLKALRDHWLETGDDLDTLCKEGVRLLTSQGFSSVDYLSVCDANTLESATSAPRNEAHRLRLCVAARLGSARLIDNISMASMIDA